MTAKFDDDHDIRRRKLASADLRDLFEDLAVLLVHGKAERERRSAPVDCRVLTPCPNVILLTNGVLAG